jgi:predicted dehydrogenase
MAKVLKVAQIGCGAFAEGQDFPNFAENPRVECVWCCDINEARAQEMAKKFGIGQVTTKIEDIMRDPEVDFIKVCTSHEAHLPIIEAAAAAGKHIFCEKPMAMENEEGFKIIRAVRKGGVKICIDLNRRMSPSLHALRKRWLAHRQNPKNNSWRYTETDRQPYPEELASHFLARVQDDTASYRLIHLDPLRGGGEIIGETVHWLDLACWWFAPQVPTAIQAWGTTRLYHGVNLKFSGGDTATILFNTGGTFDYPKEMFEVTCLGALFRNECFLENQYYGMGDPEREVFPLQRDCLPEVGKQGGLDGYQEKYYARVKGLANSKEGHNNLQMDKGHRGMLEGFVDAIINDKPSPCDEVSGFLSTYLARRAIESIRLNQPLPVPLDMIYFDVL